MREPFRWTARRERLHLYGDPSHQEEGLTWKACHLRSQQHRHESERYAFQNCHGAIHTGKPTGQKIGTYITGEPDDANVSSPVLREAEGKGLDHNTLPAACPTSLRIPWDELFHRQLFSCSVCVDDS